MPNYLPDAVPSPHTTHDDFQYWDFCRKHELRIQQCDACGTFRHPPRPVCAHCGKFGLHWTAVSGRGTVFSYTVAHHAVHPSLKTALPYNIAVVLLEGAGDVRLVSNIIDARPEEMHVDMPVDLVWEDLPDGMSLPRFRQRKETAHV